MEASYGPKVLGHRSEMTLDESFRKEHGMALIHQRPPNELSPTYGGTGRGGGGRARQRSSKPPKGAGDPPPMPHERRTVPLFFVAHPDQYCNP